MTIALTLISAGLVAIVTEPDYKSDEAIDCKFGNVGFGFGEGRVRVKAEVPRDGTYTFHIVWGAFEATRAVDLHNEVYFTFRKKEFWSNGYATASISPTAPANRPGQCAGSSADPPPGPASSDHFPGGPASSRARSRVSSFIGKKHSMRSSCRVTSCGVPNVVTVEK